MKTIIAGSRGIRDSQLTLYAITRSGFAVTEVVCGFAPGPDSHGEAYAHQHHLPVAEFRPDWDRYGNSAGFIRNNAMVDYSDALIGVWDGSSRGTKHTLDLAEKKGIPVYILLIQGEFLSEVRISGRNFF